MTNTRKRLLQDIAEINQHPYPNIKYTPFEDDINAACLVLTPAGYPPLHLRVSNLDRFPLVAPTVRIQSKIDHPNIFNDYICASILNTREGWTPAYTLKGICIQLLSFFGSDSIEQSGGSVTVSLADYKTTDSQMMDPQRAVYNCARCDFGSVSMSRLTISSPPRPLPPGADAHTYAKPTNSRKRRKPNKKSPSQGESSASKDNELVTKQILARSTTNISTLPDELVAHICSFLETEQLVPFSRAWDRIGGEHGIVNKFNIIRNRELICFCLKQGFEVAKLGVGVRVEWNGRIGSFESEFDLLCVEAFENLKIRNAVQGNPFEHWLPLPISRRHYNSVQPWIVKRLQSLAEAAKYPSQLPEDVIYGFMSDIVVRLSRTAENTQSTPSRRRHDDLFHNLGDYRGEVKSTLTHASEKAIESYYHLFHLLLCLATSDPRIVRKVNQTIKSFLDGNTSKTHVPNLGQLLIAVLISDADMTIDLLKAIVRETITRNVVWMLDKRGAGMPELSYMEANEVSQYRLQKTFDASKTSYRLLMFLNVFRQTIKRGSPQGRKSLVQIRDELFDAHGVPPAGTAARLANEIKKLQQVKTFPDFLIVMGLKPPTSKAFTTLLRQTVEDSVKMGYSVWGIPQHSALNLRLKVDPDVQIRAEDDQKKEWWTHKAGSDFFPNRGGASSNGRGGGRGRGRGRGQGRG